LSKLREPPEGRRRQSSMNRRWLCLSLVVVAAACSSSHEAVTPSTTTARSGAGSTSTSTPVVPSSGLRGVAVRAFECPSRPLSPAASPTPIEAPEALLLCPLGMPGQPSNAVTVAATQPVFHALVAALSRAHEPSTGAVCPAYADLMQVVLAKNRSGAYQVSIPTDGCGHYQRDALDALSRARGR
jgi:hypothetical protein